MSIAELYKRLREEGCNPSNYGIFASTHDAWCLDIRDGEWSVFYSERGIDSPPVFVSKSGSEACEFFFKRVTAERHWHIVGFFRHEADALALEAKLADFNIDPVRNDIRAYLKANDPRFRVFVVGKDIFRYRQHFGEPKVDLA